MTLKVSHICAARPVESQRGVPQGAPEAPVVVTTLVDEILEPLASSSATGRLGWACDGLHLTCLPYADDVMVFAESLEKLTCMFRGLL